MNGKMSAPLPPTINQQQQQQQQQQVDPQQDLSRPRTAYNAPDQHCPPPHGGVVVNGTVASCPPPHAPACPIAGNAVPPLMPSHWATGVCDFCDDTPSCVEVLCCWTCQQARQYNMLTKRSPEVDWLVCCGIFCVDSFTGCGSLGMAWYIRQTLRRRYNIPGGDCEDGCLTFWLTGCVMCQNYREMSARGDWPQGFCVSVPYTNPAVQQPPQMQPPMGCSVAPAPMSGTDCATF